MPADRFRTRAETASLWAAPVVWTAPVIMRLGHLSYGWEAGGWAAAAGITYGVTHARCWWVNRRIMKHPEAGILPPDPASPTRAAAATGLIGAWETVATAGAAHLISPEFAVIAAAGLAGSWYGLRRFVRNLPVVAEQHRIVAEIEAREAAEQAERLAREAKQAEWRDKARRWRLTGSWMVLWEPTRLGERYCADVVGTPYKRASAVPRREIAEHIEQDMRLPRNTVKIIEDQDIAGRVWIDIRSKDPWEGEILHPYLKPDHEITLQTPTSVRYPIYVGQDPQTGRPLVFTIFDELGAKNILIVAKRGGGKSALISAIRERLTACVDAATINVNLSQKIREDTLWAPAALLNAIGDHKDEVGRANAILDWILSEIKRRTSTHRETEHFVPTQRDPLLALFVDEISSAVRAHPLIKDKLRQIAQQGRSEAIALIVAGQRGVASWLGGTDLRSQIDIVWVGRVNRRAEINNTLGELATYVPDMTTFAKSRRDGKAKPGVWACLDLDSLEVQTGRGWRLTNPPELAKLAAERARATFEMPSWTMPGEDAELYRLLRESDRSFQRKPRPRQPEIRPEAGAEAGHSPTGSTTAVLDRPGPEVKPEAVSEVRPEVRAEAGMDEVTRRLNRNLAGGEHARLDLVRARTAAARQRLDQLSETQLHENVPLHVQWDQVGETTVIPPAVEPELDKMINAPGGTTIKAVRTRFKVSAWTARTWLERRRTMQLAHVTGTGKNRRWVPGPDPSQSTQRDDEREAR